MIVLFLFQPLQSYAGLYYLRVNHDHFRNHYSLTLLFDLYYLSDCSHYLTFKNQWLLQLVYGSYTVPLTLLQLYIITPWFSQEITIVFVKSLN